MKKYKSRFNLKFLTATVSIAIVTSAFIGSSFDVSAVNGVETPATPATPDTPAFSQVASADDVEIPTSSASQVSAAVCRVKREVGVALQKKRETEEARKAQEAQAAEEARKAQEAQAAEEARKAQEAQAAEEAKKVEERRRSQSANRGRNNHNSNESTGRSGFKSAPAASSSAGQAIVNAARSCIGVAYGANRGGISLDCSGLAQYSYRAAGIGISHSAAGLYSSCTKVSNPRPGDLVFWASGGRVNHVEVYVGGGRAVGANLPGRPIGEHGLWSSSSQKIIGYGRFY